jgi:hypothetical protein
LGAGLCVCVCVRAPSFEYTCVYTDVNITMESLCHNSEDKRQSVDAGVKVILPAVLYGCETWSLNLSEEH